VFVRQAYSAIFSREYHIHEAPVILILGRQIVTERGG